MSTTVTIVTDDLDVIEQLADTFSPEAQNATEQGKAEAPAEESTDDEGYLFGRKYDTGFNVGIEHAADTVIENLPRLYEIFLSSGQQGVEQVIRDAAKEARR